MAAITIHSDFRAEELLEPNNRYIRAKIKPTAEKAIVTSKSHPPQIKQNRDATERIGLIYQFLEVTNLKASDPTMLLKSIKNSKQVIK